MANAANSPFVKHPALLALFAPRPPPPFKPPLPRRSNPKLSGIANLTTNFLPKDELPPVQKFETANERRERIKKEKLENHANILAEREKKWDPHNNPNATKDPYKTLFVARLSYELSEEDLRDEFERYGRIRDVKLIKDKETQKSRGYAFIEFERSNDLKEAFQHADGHKLKGRRILVDVERGRTVKTWKPRKLAGGLGKTRAGPNSPKNDKNSNHGHHSTNHSSRASKAHSDYSSKKKMDSKYSSRRDKYRDRDFRDRDRRRSDRKDRSRHDRDTKRRSRSRSRDRKDRKPRRDKKDRYENRERGERRDRDRDRARDRDSNKDRSSRKDKDRSRRHRSRSKEKTRRR